MRRTLLVALAVASACTSKGAPGGVEPASVAECAEPFANPIGYVVDTVFAEVEAGYALRETPLSVLERLAIALGSSLELPQPLPMPSVVRAVLPLDRGVQGFAGEVIVNLDKGRVSPPVLSQSTLVPALDSALLRATERMTSRIPEQMAAAAKRAQHPAIFTRLRTAGRLSEEKSNQKDTTSAMPPLPAARLPVVAVRSPTIALTYPARANRKFRAPSYPHEMLMAGMDGRATFEFVIGGDGRVVPGTLRIIGATNTSFARSSYQAFDRARYAPAMLGDCSVRTLVAQPFVFQMNR